MFEKIKDFLYDISDIVVSLVIIGVIFFSVSWKISDTLSIDINSPANNTIEIGTTSDETEIIVTPVDPTESTEATSEGETQVGETTEAPVVTTEAPTQAATEAPTTQASSQTLENFVVEEGWLGETIGKNLQEKGFVANYRDFVSRLIEMGYDSKLRSGTFKLSKTDSLDTIIKVLAGEKR